MGTSELFVKSIKTAGKGVLYLRDRLYVIHIASHWGEGGQQYSSLLYAMETIISSGSHEPLVLLVNLLF